MNRNTGKVRENSHFGHLILSTLSEEQVGQFVITYNMNPACFTIHPGSGFIKVCSF